MLSRLRIKNLALIEDLALDFEIGMNVLTGETGAGKSIIIDAVGLLTGDRADKNLIQTGYESALVEGLFHIDDSKIQLLTLLAQMGITLEDDYELLISRQINQSGKSTCRVNGAMVTLSNLKAIMFYLIDIHGQHEHQSLLSPENHIKLLDSIGDSDLEKQKKEVADFFHKWKENKRELSSLIKSNRDEKTLKDIIHFKIDELTKAKLKQGELDELLQERLVLQNAEKIKEALSNSYSLLFMGDQQQKPCYDQLAKVSNNLKQIAQYNIDYERLSLDFESIFYQFQDVIAQVRNCFDACVESQSRLDEVENRVSILQSLKRKYNLSIEEIIEHKKHLEEQLLNIDLSNEKILELEKTQMVLSDKLLSSSQCLSKKRIRVARDFEVKIVDGLKSLGMENARFEVMFFDQQEASDALEFTENGIDKVEFFVSTNKGEPLKSLAKTVSGGEVSRIMLALKTISAKTDAIPVLIFDEADAGISGRIAQVVSQKMLQVSRNHHVICVTHLPQIAAMADVHFKVSKDFFDSRTKTHVEKLNSSGKEMEIAQMLGTEVPTKLGIEHARELIQNAAKYKKNFLKLD